MKHLLASCLRSAAIAALTGGAMASAAHAADLRIALADDPDALDAMTNRAQTGITVLTAMCDRLMWTDTALNITPGLAKSWTWSEDGKTLTLSLVEGVKYQDGTPFDAASVKLNIERYKNTKGSQRADDISSIESIEAPSATQVVIRTKAPAAQLTAKLAERIGIMFSPAAIDKQGENLGRAPVCAGPYKFAERVAQDRIVLQKDPTYFDASKYQFDRVIFRIIPDDAVRLANLQSGEIDIMEKLDPSNAEQVKSDKKLQVLPITLLNNQTLVLNFNQAGPMQNPKIREAFEYALDRQAIVDVAFAGVYQAGNQFAAPDSPFYNSEFPIPARNPAKAKALIAEAGLKEPVPFTILVPNRPLSVRVGEMMQAMGSEAGFAVKLDVVDFATTLKMTDEGKFESWGPIGPQFANDLDTVVYPVLHSTGGRNLSRYKSPEMDKLLEESRVANNPDKRKEVFKEAAALAAKDRPVLYLYHQKPLFAARANLDGFHTTGDGFPRIDGLKLK